MVKEVNEDHVVIDGNHPFAGKELIFDIEVVEVV
jgi:FKBP-type peptidyl-prolyl cis-trans isomerase 2